MKLEYQAARPSDIDIIFALNKELVETYENLDTIDYPKVLEWVYRKIRQHINQYMCILADHQKAGYYYFHQSGEEMELDDLYVFPEFRNKGIGTAVIAKCCSEVSVPVFLYVFVKNEKAIALYQRLGFQIVSQIRETRYVMRRTVSTA